MKYTITLFVVFSITNLFAQPGYSINEEMHSYNGLAARNVYKMRIEKAQKEYVLKALEKRLESGTKKEALVNESKISIEKVVYKNYWSDSLVIEVEIVEIENGTMCFFSFLLDTASIGSKKFPEYDVQVNRYLKKFGLEMYEDALDKELTVEQKHLKSIEKEHKVVLKSIDKSTEEIKDNNIEIELKRDAIAINKSDREVKLAEIESQKAVITNVPAGDGEQLKLEKKKLKNIKGEYKKLKKDYKKINKQITKMENGIRDAELEKEKLLAQEAAIKERMMDQNKTIEAVKSKQHEVDLAWKAMK